MGKIKTLFLVIKGWILPWSSPFEELTDTALSKLNSLLGKDERNIQKMRSAVESVLALLVKYADWCPSPWRNEFDAIVLIVRKLVDVFADSRVDDKELKAVVSEFKKAYAKWNED